MWEDAVERREGFTTAEKKNMILSAATIEGLKLTGMDIKSGVVWFISVPPLSLSSVKSFIGMAQYVLALLGAPPVLSRRITQDPLEKYFGLQRQRGSVNENPSSQEFF